MVVILDYVRFLCFVGGSTFLFMGVVNLASLNINEAIESRKREQMFEMMQKIYDVLSIQETY